MAYQVDGVIALTAHFEADSVTQFTKHNIPVVLYNRELPEHSVNSVCCNHEQGVKMLVDILIENQHQQFLIMAGPKDSDVARARLSGARNALLSHGFTDTSVVYGDYSYDSARESLQTYASSHPLPTAIICANDTMAIGAIDEIRENHQLRVPEDISVVGFDGISAAHWYNYQLTTVSQPTYFMTKAAVETLVNLIDNPDIPPETRYWPGELITGNSVAPARSKNE